MNQQQFETFMAVGLVNEVVPAEALLARAQEILDTIIGNAPIATRLATTLSDPSRHAVAGQRRVIVSAPAPTPDAAGAVLALDAALGPLIDEVVA
jgi:enoyl-CoA hydratase/carnithine racemase